MHDGYLVKEGNLHKWFSKSKSKDGKKGWVNVVTGGTCASDKPGEGTPKCVSSAKRASMTKAERLSAQRRKKKADPNQQQKSGAAKPTYVKTDKPKKKMKEATIWWSQKALDQLDALKMAEAKVDQGKDDYAKMNDRNQRTFGNRRGSKKSNQKYDDTEARRYNTEKGRGVKMRGKKDKTRVNYHEKDRQKAVDELLGRVRKEEGEVYWSSTALDQLDEINAKERFKRDAGAIAKKKMRNKEHRKYVNFLDVDENTIHSFNTFIQNNKPYDSQKEVSEESDKESKVETSLLKFSECWKTHKKVGMKMKGGKLVNDCRPKTASDYKKEEVELDEKVYTGPDKKDRALIKKMDNPSYAKKLADYEKNMDPKKRQALKDKATKGMKFTHEGRDLALDAVRAKYKDQIMKRGQPKKVKGAKSTVGTGKYKKMADQKKQTAADAKKRGFKSTQDYVNTMARYGGKDNYDKGKGLGS